MNKVFIIGRTTKDIDSSTSSSGTSIAKFTIAVDRKFPNQDGEKVTDFLNCVAFGKLAETIGKYVKKGHKISIEGELWTNTYENEKGEKRHSFSICVSEIEFLEKKSNEVQGGSNTQPELTEIDDDSLPF
mgnify:CR=1 FL=1